MKIKDFQTLNFSNSAFSHKMLVVWFMLLVGLPARDGANILVGRYFVFLFYVDYLFGLIKIK